MDIDIDTRGDFNAKEVFPQCIKASIVKNSTISPHPAGVYFQSIPVDPISGLSAIPYDKAEEMGFMKIDLLHLPSVLDYFESKEEIRALMKIEPDWKILEEEEQVKKLFQLGNHFWLVSKVKPKTVQEVADCCALIRPGKSALVKKYLQDKEKVRKVLYMPPSDGGYYFKRSHSISYAHNIVLQMHLIKGGIL